MLDLLPKQQLPIHSGSSILLTMITFGMVTTPAIGFGSWSNGDRNTSQSYLSIGWVNVQQLRSSATQTPALAGSNESLHLITAELFGTFRVQDFVWTKSDGWSAPVSLPVLPDAVADAFGPALAYRGNGIYDVVIQGKAQYYHAFFNPGAGWSKWEPIGGRGSDPAVTTSTFAGSPAVDVWAQGGGSIWHRRWKNSSWQAWEEIGRPSGKTLATAPGVVVRPGGIIDIVAGTTGDGQLYHAYFSPDGKFGGWDSVPGKTLSKPAVTSPASTRLDVWSRGATTPKIYHLMWDAHATTPGWSGSETSINVAPVPGPSFATGVAAVLVGGITTVASIDSSNRVLVRSWADPTSAGVTVQPTATVTNTLISLSAENSVAVVPPSTSATQSECKDGEVIYSRGASLDLVRVGYRCAFDGVGQQPISPQGVCPGNPIPKTAPAGSGSNDNQIVRLRDGTLVWVFQSGGVLTPAVLGCKRLNVTRGTETVRVSTDCGKTWSLVATLDPCVGRPFTVSDTCNTNAVSCTSSSSTCYTDCWNDTSNHPKMPSTGTDRPELLASTYENNVYMALGVAGPNNYNLHFMAASGGLLGSWNDLDTGLPSGGAVAMAETDTYLYFARAEHGSPSNAGLYRILKNRFFANKPVSLGNLMDQEVAGNMQLSLMTDTEGDLVFRWAYLTSRGSIRRGFSKLTPGGIVTLASDLYQPPHSSITALPTLISLSAASKRAFLYWYEGTSDNRGPYSVKGAMSDGVGHWSTPITLAGPWSSWASFTSMGQPGNDYLKGVYMNGKDTFFATWLQPDSGTSSNRLGQAAVK